MKTRRLHRRRAEQDWVVAMKVYLHLHHGPCPSIPVPPSRMISALAGNGRRVTGPAITLLGAPLMLPAKSYSEWPSGKYSNPEIRGITHPAQTVVNAT